MRILWSCPPLYRWRCSQVAGPYHHITAVLITCTWSSTRTNYTKLQPYDCALLCSIAHMLVYKVRSIVVRGHFAQLDHLMWVSRNSFVKSRLRWASMRERRRRVNIVLAAPSHSFRFRSVVESLGSAQNISESCCADVWVLFRFGLVQYFSRRERF